MKIQKKDLIFIHKFIWSYVYKEVELIQDRNMINSTLGVNIRSMKNKAVNLLLDEEIINNTMSNYLSLYNFCILCLLFRCSENRCFDCPLKDCHSQDSMYQKTKKGSLLAIRDIYYSIDKALIPEHIEIQEK